MRHRSASESASLASPSPPSTKSGPYIATASSLAAPSSNVFAVRTSQPHPAAACSGVRPRQSLRNGRSGRRASICSTTSGGGRNRQTLCRAFCPVKSERFSSADNTRFLAAFCALAMPVASAGSLASRLAIASTSRTARTDFQSCDSMYEPNFLRLGPAQELSPLEKALPRRSVNRNDDERAGSMPFSCLPFSRECRFFPEDGAFFSFVGHFPSTASSAVGAAADEFLVDLDRRSRPPKRLGIVPSFPK
mmetsp:Transcript_24654/g.49957  ORF Transcript_24654/g.49957 Transcript_24654/m.49957 type:complete len:249 (+) Transcript_24654:367-1113(+)